jgi:hypothetical protein
VPLSPQYGEKDRHHRHLFPQLFTTKHLTGDDLAKKIVTQIVTPKKTVTQK